MQNKKTRFQKKLLKKGSRNAFCKIKGAIKKCGSVRSNLKNARSLACFEGGMYFLPYAEGSDKISELFDFCAAEYYHLSSETLCVLKDG